MEHRLVPGLWNAVSLIATSPIVLVVVLVLVLDFRGRGKTHRLSATSKIENEDDDENEDDYKDDRGRLSQHGSERGDEVIPKTASKRPGRDLLLCDPIRPCNVFFLAFAHSTGECGIVE